MPPWGTTSCDACWRRMLLDLLNGALDRNLRRGGETRDRLGERLALDLEAERHRAHVGHDLRLAEEQDRPRGVRRAIGGDGREPADRADLAVREHLFAVEPPTSICGS